LHSSSFVLFGLIHERAGVNLGISFQKERDWGKWKQDQTHSLLLKEKLSVLKSRRLQESKAAGKKSSEPKAEGNDDIKT
jgi:hypothetical protein